MRRKDFSNVECSIARAVDEIGEPWSLLILRHGFLGARRFAQFQAALEIPPNTLSSRLEDLCRKGLLHKMKYENHPPRYEYSLSEKALDLLPVIVSLAVWGSRWKSPKGAPFELVDPGSGAPIEPILIDARTGKPIRPGAIGLRPGPGASSKLRRLVAATGKKVLPLGPSSSCSSSSAVS